MNQPRQTQPTQAISLLLAVAVGLLLAVSIVLAAAPDADSQELTECPTTADPWTGSGWVGWWWLPDQPTEFTATSDAYLISQVCVEVAGHSPEVYPVPSAHSALVAHSSGLPIVRFSLFKGEGTTTTTTPDTTTSTVPETTTTTVPDTTTSSTVPETTTTTGPEVTTTTAPDGTTTTVPTTATTAPGPPTEHPPTGGAIAVPVAAAAVCLAVGTACWAAKRRSDRLAAAE